MDYLDIWRDTLERMLRRISAISYANDGARTDVAFDRARDRYLLVDVSCGIAVAPA